MSNHNYSQYSNKNNNQNRNFDNRPKPVVEKPVEPVAPAAPATAIEPTAEAVTPVVNLVEETVETKPVSELVDGTVVGCAKLNVRSAPSITGDILAVISADSDVKIDVAKSNFEWFHVCTATGIEGYCMRKFVNAHL